MLLLFQSTSVLFRSGAPQRPVALTRTAPSENREAKREGSRAAPRSDGATGLINCSSTRAVFQGEASMDKQEAERLVRAIERMHVAWIQVDRIVFNETRNAYELECSYRGPAGRLGARAIWRSQRITSPREWIGLLTKHRDTL